MTFIYVLDEAQVAGDSVKGHMGAFADANGAIRRSVLRPIVCAWTAPTGRDVNIIVSGTGFHQSGEAKVIRDSLSTTDLSSCCPS